MENFIAIISPSIALISGLVLWFLNEKGKRRHAIYSEKIDLYEKILSTIGAIYEEGIDNPKLKQEFDRNFRVAWLYASKEVIEKLCSFLDTIRTDKNISQEEVSNALDLLVVAIRKDIKLSNPTRKFMVWRTK